MILGRPAETKKALFPRIDFENNEHTCSGNWEQRERLRQYRKFIGNMAELDFVLDVGTSNFIGRSLFPSCYNTTGDLNDDWSADQPAFNLIFCFEVLEHLGNPLLFLGKLRSITNLGGVVYLSTPRLAGVRIFHSPLHVTEYTIPVLAELFRRSGFSIKRLKVFRHHPWWTITGIRPFIRWFFLKIVIFELEAI